ncbi:hypothetical protein QTO34_004885, partial [Cnephaeus nilssonii]
MTWLASETVNLKRTDPAPMDQRCRHLNPRGTDNHGSLRIGRWACGERGPCQPEALAANRQPISSLGRARSGKPEGPSHKKRRRRGRYFQEWTQEQLAALKKQHEAEITHHTKEIERLQKEMERHKQNIKKLKDCGGVRVRDSHICGCGPSCQQKVRGSSAGARKGTRKGARTPGPPRRRCCPGRMSYQLNLTAHMPTASLPPAWRVLPVLPAAELHAGNREQPGAPEQIAELLAIIEELGKEIHVRGDKRHIHAGGLVREAWPRRGERQVLASKSAGKAFHLLPR